MSLLSAFLSMVGGEFIENIEVVRPIEVLSFGIAILPIAFLNFLVRFSGLRVGT